MNSSSSFFQEAVENHVADIASRSLKWIYDLPMHSDYKFEYAGQELLGVIQFLPKERGRKRNSFMLSICRTLSKGVYRSYSSGFFFEKEKVIEFSTDQLLLSEYDKT